MNASADEPLILSDHDLSRRLERAEARANADFVEARASLFPNSGARWIEVAGAYALYDGVASPATQTFGLGLFDKVTSAEMEVLENFFQERRAPVFHEVSPLADLFLLALLNERGYQPIEFTSVMFRPIRRDLRLPTARNERIEVRLVQEADYDLMAQTAARGWSEHGEVAGQVEELARVGAGKRRGLSFLARLDGKAIATGWLSMCEGVALLAGASTIPEARKQGAQLALLETRLRCGAEQGCDIAMMCAQPGSASQRNAERHGFRIAYTRIKWRLPAKAHETGTAQGGGKAPRA
jgi:hypothetical protein